MGTTLSGYDPNTIQPWTLRVTVSIVVLSVVCVGLRLLSRRLNGQALWIDDWLIIFSMLWNLVVTGFIFAMYAAGMGRHIGEVGLDGAVEMAKFLLVAEILYVYNLVWTKLSVLAMYYRIFRFAYFKRMAIIIGAFCIVWVVCITFLFIFICVPVQKLWYPDLPGHCINQVATWIANATSTILTDLVILLLPMPQVWKLNLRTGVKIALTLAFALGFFVVFASAYRFSVLFSYSNADPTYTLAPTVGWTSIEMGAGIISACLPTMLPAIRLFIRTVGLDRAFGHLFSTVGMTVTGGGGGGHDHGQRSTRGKSGTGKEASSSSMVAHGGKHDPFYRLSDDNASDGSQLPIDSGLRPQHGHEHVVTTLPASRDDSGGIGIGGSSDEIPLQGIRVHTDFKYSSTSR